MKKPFLVNSQFFKNKKGDVIKYISKKSKYFKKFGEIYFSEIKKNKIKGWIKHTRNTCIICVPSGKVKFFTFKENFHDKKKFILSKKINKLLIIPPGYWFSFLSINKISLVANLIDDVHSDNEVMKKNI
jgi:dTDP-4-dehydrorhamnose 3,5-epimerase-like enzyme